MVRNIFTYMTNKMVNLELARKYLVEDLKKYSAVDIILYCKAVNTLLDEIERLTKENQTLKDTLKVKPKEKIVYRKR